MSTRQEVSEKPRLVSGAIPKIVYYRLSGTMDHSQSLAKCFGKFKEGNCVTRIYTRYAVCSPSVKIVVIGCLIYEIRIFKRLLRTYSTLLPSKMH